MKQILALIDFSEMTPAVVNVARDLALAFKGELLLMLVVESEADFVDSESDEDVPLEDQYDNSPQAIARCAHYHEMDILNVAMKKEGVNVQTRIVEANLKRQGILGTILHEMARLSPDFIVVGSHRHGHLYKLLVGSVTDAVMRNAKCPVVIVSIRTPEKAGL